MRQILQEMSNGKMTLIIAPSPNLTANSVLISTRATLVSVGTERMLVNFGKACLLNKIRQKPEKAKMVLEKLFTDGLVTTAQAIRAKLAQPLTLGYCNVGVIEEMGLDISGFNRGDRVASNGPHADIVRVPKNLCARIPDNVDDESAAFTVVASIGLQGIRLVQPTLGEAVVVTGVGLIGLLTVQLLLANGCRVLAIDFDPSRLELARQFGAETCDLSQGDDPISVGMAFSHGIGVDAVIITASTTSNDPVTQAARMSRKRGRIVLVGVTGLELNRADFYEKELSFQVSCSYGPGRYDPAYETKGQDYPISFVRWTEQRNFEAVLDMMASGLLNVKPLITHRFAFEDAQQAYQLLSQDKSALGILLHYTSDIKERRIKRVTLNQNHYFSAGKPVVGFIGAGNYSSRVLIPAFKAAGAQLQSLVSENGITSVIHGKSAGFTEATTDVEAMLSNPSINTVAIVTRHDTHAGFALQALKAGKHVFIEKPLAINIEELTSLEDLYFSNNVNHSKPILMVGFNRRFSPQIQKMKELLDSIKEPKSFIAIMNAGAIPVEHWTQDQNVGGGRIIGEACHLIDLLRFLAGSQIVSLQTRKMGINPYQKVTEDKAVILLGFADGSFGTIHYLANGPTRFPKERLEVFASGRLLQLDNFRKLKGYGWPGFNNMNLWKQDKGQKSCVAAFLRAIEQGTNSPIPVEEIFEVAKTTIQAAHLLRNQ